MKKVVKLDHEPDATITLKGRVDDRKVNRDVKVQKLWDEFNEAAPGNAPTRRPDTEMHAQCLALLSGRGGRSVHGTA